MYSLVRNRGFQRLFATRMVGSFGDGLFQAALASFVLFSPERQPTPLAIAGLVRDPAPAVLPSRPVRRGLPRPLAAPAGPRESELAARLALLVTIGVVTAGHDGMDLGIVVLIALGLGRFVLSGLSAALPHVVPQDQLVTANAIAPTAGTVIYGIGALIGVSLQGVLGGGDTAVAWLLFAGALTYFAAGTIPLSLGRDRLGPEGDRPESRPGTSCGDWRRAFRVLSHDRPSWHSLAVILIHRVAFGALTVLILLILRNTINPTSDPEAALRGFSVIAATVTVGAFLAAVVTPTMTRRIGTVRWTSITLIVCAVAAPMALLPLTVAAIAIGGAVVGLAQQAAKIGADTTLQHRIADDHLGRVFSLYDVGVNVCLVLGALIVAFAAPLSGVTVPGFFLLGAVYLATALWYWSTTRTERSSSTPALGPPLT